MSKWYVAERNDALFIVNQRPSDANDTFWQDRRPPTFVQLIGKASPTSREMLQTVCDQHNAELAQASAPTALQNLSARRAATDELVALREQFVELISAYSEDRWAASWMSGIEAEIRTIGGAWIVQALVCGGWPIGYRGEDGWAPLTEAELTTATEWLSAHQDDTDENEAGMR